MDFLITGIGIFWLIFFLILIIILPLWALFDLLRSNFEDNIIKLIWTIVILFAPVIGSMLYFSIGVKQKEKYKIRKQ